MNKTEWKKVKLGEICEMYQPKTISQEEMISDGKYPVFGANGIIGRYDKYNHEHPQLLITCRGATCGTINISKPFSWITGNSMVVRPKSESQMSFEYLSYYLGQKHLIAHVITGAAQPQITRTNLQELEILFPTNLQTQHKIAQTLDTTNKLITLRKKQIEELDTLAEAVFYDMFGDPVKNEKGWEIVELKNCATKYTDGPFGSNLKTEHYSTLGIPLIRLQNIGGNKFIDNDISYICENHYNNVLKKYTCFPEDVVIAALVSPNLRACIVPNIFSFAINKADCILFRPNKKMCVNYYISYLLNSQGFQQMVQSLIHGQTRARIASGQLAKVQIPLPPLALQNHFASIIEKIEQQKTIARQALQESENLFQRLMQDLFQPN